MITRSGGRVYIFFMTRDFLWDFSFKLDNTGICTVSAKLCNLTIYLEIYLDDWDYFRGFHVSFFKVLAFFPNLWPFYKLKHFVNF